MATKNINVVVISGNLTADPDLRQTKGGTSVCEMRLANNVGIKRGDVWETKANFLQVNAWGAQGENCAKYLKKGSAVFVEGRLDWQKWENKDDGKTNSRVVIVADTIQFPPRPHNVSDEEASGASQPESLADDDDIGF